MTLADTTRWIGQSESQTLEFKSVVDPKAIAENICGMLNANGGVIAAGVADDGSILGINDAETQVEELDRKIRNRISPPASWSLINADAGGKSVLVVDVPNGSRKPYVVDGKIFIRVGDVNRLATAGDINGLIQDRIRSDEHWERQPAVGMMTSDLDASEIHKTIRQAVDAGRLDSSVTGIEEALTRLNLVIDGRPIQAAVVAFASEVLPWYPQCTLRLAKFSGDSKDEFVDQKKISGHAFRLLEEANRFVGKHLEIRGEFDEHSFFRKDRPLYPTLALREALVNALCHRDYSIAGGAVSIAIFENRLEIASTGSLPYGLTVASLKGDHFSQPRNPLLADIFYRRGLIELWGRGTQGIMRMCLDAGCPEPQFEERAGEFVVRFFSPNHLAIGASGQLTERQSRILTVLRTSSKRSLREIRETVDPSLLGQHGQK